jgi:hypothetical protein
MCVPRSGEEPGNNYNKERVMPKNNNFSSTLTIQGDGLNVTGTSDVLPDAKLVSRHVAITQNGFTIEGPASLDLAWGTDPVLGVGKITTGDALAIAIETHVISDRPFFVTETWAEVVKIEKAAQVAKTKKSAPVAKTKTP